MIQIMSAPWLHTKGGIVESIVRQKLGNTPDVSKALRW